MASGILVVGLVLEVLFVFSHGANRILFGDGYVLSLDHDQSLPSWATSALFAVAGLACGLFAGFERAARGPFAVLAAVCVGLSMEQVVQLHSRVESSVDDSKLIEVALGLAVVATIVFAARRLAAPHRQLLLSSIAALVLSELASQANQSLDLPHAGVVFFQALEEVLEMVTAILIVAAVAEPLWRAVVRRAVAGRPPAEATDGF